MSTGYVLVSPSGRVVVETFDVEREMCEGLAFQHLNALYAWPRKYWKQWEEFCTERERRGWKVRPAQVVLT